MSCGRAVGADFFSRGLARFLVDRSIVVQIRAALRLRSEAASPENPRCLSLIRSSRLASGALRGPDDVNTTPVRIKQEINGRPYLIEVRPVGQSRWRAEVRGRGPMTSLMPFYGETAAAAAELLTGWLRRAAGPRKAV
jgi:hypothetical protein